MLAVKFALHNALSIVLQRFLLVGSLSFKLLLPQLILQVSDVLPRYVALLVLLVDLSSQFSDLLIQPLLV